MRHRQGQGQVNVGRKSVHHTSWRWLVFFMLGGLLGGWHLPVAWGQELTGGMKLIMEELRAVKKSQAEALAQVEDLRRQLQALSAGGLTAVELSPAGQGGIRRASRAHRPSGSVGTSRPGIFTLHRAPGTDHAVAQAHGHVHAPDRAAPERVWACPMI